MSHVIHTEQAQVIDAGKSQVYVEMATQSSDAAVRYPSGGLVSFFVLTFAFTWGLAALVVFFPGLFESLFGKLSASSPIFILAVAGPSLMATVLTFARNGWPGVRGLYARLFEWRFGLRWYAGILGGIPLLAFLLSRVTSADTRYDLSTPLLFLTFLLNQLILGPLGEELGWRGFALPRLLQRFNPFIASLILGLIWGVWHLPSFFLSGLPQASLALPVFLFFTLCQSILVTWIFRHTSGSLLSQVLFHFMMNTSQDTFGTPLTGATLVAAVAAGLVLVLDRELHWFRRAPLAGS